MAQPASNTNIYITFFGLGDEPLPTLQSLREFAVSSGVGSAGTGEAKVLSVFQAKR